MTLMVYNTLSRKKEPLDPIEPGKVGIYTCGPTVYNFIHIGNARPFVVFDVVRRYLQYRGYEVTYVQNVTDVDDKIIQKANEEGVTADEIARKFTAYYFEDCDALGVRPADHQPRATELIPEMTGYIEILIEKGYAYEIDGDVFFDISTFEEYGRLSHQKTDELMEGVRIDVDPRLHHPLDFALWKAAKPGEPSWESPWGEGRPGWHIECSVMSSKFLGDDFDIHCGGHDLVFPHHENEIAQSRAATGKGFAKVWLHNGYINIGGTKMSKSLGNVTLVREILKDNKPEAVRHFLLSAHYRKPIDYNETSLAESESALQRVYTAIDKAERHAALLDKRSGEPGEDLVSLDDFLEKLTGDFEGAMDDDFNTPKAIASIFDTVRALNKLLDGPDAWKCAPDALRSVTNEIRRLGAVLGLFQQGAAAGDSELTGKLMELFISLRAEARIRKDYALADSIRDRLAELGISLEDTPDGTFWREKELS